MESDKLASQININMRCIEILLLDCGLRRQEVININMRCIEIRIAVLRCN